MYVSSQKTTWSLQQHQYDELSLIQHHLKNERKQERPEQYPRIESSGNRPCIVCVCVCRIVRELIVE